MDAKVSNQEKANLGIFELQKPIWQSVLINV